MIIRRRTYIKLFTDKYGYFMRNFNYYLGYSGGSASAGSTLATNIYTKCMLKETPVGAFPLSYRTATSAVSSSDSSPRYVAVGETDGSVIYVVTAKSVYKSINGGASFSLTTSNWNSSSYISGYTGPIVYVDDTYLYILYTEMDYTGDYSCYYRLKLVKILRSNDIIVSTTQLDSIYQTWSSNTHKFDGDPFDSTYGAFFSLNVSPRGQVMFFYKVYSDRRCWKVFDLPRGVASGLITINSTVGLYTFNMWESAGEWYNDGSTYGKFFISGIASMGSNYDYNYYYNTVTCSLFSSGLNLTLTDIKSTLGNIITDNYSYVGDPRLFIASCLNGYKNKLFIYGTRGDVYDQFGYVCDASFNNAVALPVNLDKIFSDTHYALAPLSGYSGLLAGIFVTPDGYYGCVFWNYAAITFDLRTNTYFVGYDFESADDNGALSYISTGTCFMLPKSVSNV